MFNGSASPVMQNIGGKDYWFSPLTFKGCCLIDNHIRGRVLEAARNSLSEDASPAIRQETLDAAFRSLSSLSFLGGSTNFMGTFEGIVFVAWVSLIDKQPTITLDEAASIMFDKGAQESFMGMIKAQMGRGSDPTKTPLKKAERRKQSNQAKST